MDPNDEQHEPVASSEQRGGPRPGPDEADQKGPWAAKAGEGVVPPELGGSDAPDSLQAEDSELSSDALGQSAASDEPATESGVDTGAGDAADATTHGGPKPPADTEPDLRDAAAGPRQSDLDSAG
jgi:hypothetical protein